MKLIFVISYFFTALLSTSLAAYTISNKPKDPAARYWSAVCVGVAFWSLFGASGFSSAIYEVGLLLNRISNASASYIPAFFIGFVYCIIGKKPTSQKIFLISLVMPILCTIFMLHPVFIPSAEQKFGLTHYSNAGPLFIAYTIHFIFFASYGEYLLFKYLRSGSIDAKQKSSAWLIFLGTSTGFAAGSVTFFGIYDVPINPLPSCFVWLFTLFGTAAIAKHNLFGIQITSREFPYFLIVAVSTTLYLGTTILFAQFISSILNFSSPAQIIFTFVLCGLLLRPLQSLFENAASYLFFKSTPKQLRNINSALLIQIEKERRLSETSILAAGMAHEIKNPLTALKTFARYLPDRYDDPVFREKCSRIIQDEVDRINNIVVQLLEFSSPKSLNVVQCNLKQLIDETLSLLSINLVNKSIEVVNSVPKDISALIDKDRMRQVLLNLLLNSIEACSDRDSIFILFKSNTSKSENGVFISVQDTGCGMTESQLQHLFDPFYSENKENGTGLGMSIVKRIIEDHDGQINVESTLNQGTTFTIYIPHSKTSS